MPDLRQETADTDAALSLLSASAVRERAHEMLDLALAEQNIKLDAVVALEADPKALVERMLRRAGIEGREDDNEESIRNRIAVYHAETKDLLDVYGSRGLLVAVDAIGSVGEVRQRLLDALDARLSG